MIDYNSAIQESGGRESSIDFNIQNVNTINIDKVVLIYVDGVLSVRENEKWKMKNEFKLLNFELDLDHQDLGENPQDPNSSSRRVVRAVFLFFVF